MNFRDWFSTPENREVALIAFGFFLIIICALMLVAYLTL